MPTLLEGMSSIGFIFCSLNKAPFFLSCAGHGISISVFIVWFFLLDKRFDSVILFFGLLLNFEPIAVEIANEKVGLPLFL